MTNAAYRNVYFAVSESFLMRISALDLDSIASRCLILDCNIVLNSTQFDKPSMVNKADRLPNVFRSYDIMCNVGFNRSLSKSTVTSQMSSNFMLFTSPN